MTPTKEEIVKRAQEQYHKENPHILTNPEESELRESGYLIAAQQELMYENRHNSYSEQFGNLDKFDTCLEQEKTELKDKQLIQTESLEFNVAEAMASGVSVLGGRQCGKSTLAMQLTDTIKKRAIVYAIDPSTAWLRRRKDFDVLTIPQRTRQTRLISWNLSNTIFDTSTLNPDEQRDFTELFAQTTMQMLISTPEQARPHVFVWLEESHNSLPLWIFHSKKMPELKRLITVGANFNVSFGLITQFAAEVSKLPIKATQQRYFGLTSEPNDIRYIKGFIGKEQAEELRNLATGEFFYSHKNILKRFRTKRENTTSETVFNYAMSMENRNSKGYLTTFVHSDS